MFIFETSLQCSSIQNDDIIIPSKDVYDLLAGSSNGDIRSCINSLQFYCMQCKFPICPLVSKF